MDKFNIFSESMMTCLEGTYTEEGAIAKVREKYTIGIAWICHDNTGAPHYVSIRGKLFKVTEADAQIKQPTNARKVVVNIGEQEVELLGLLIANEKSPLYVRELQQAGYTRSILKLESIEYCVTYLINGFRRIDITSKGKIFFESV